jgi:hypothetical protein
MSAVELYVDPCGRARCLYTEVLDLSALGELSVCRASRVEPDDRGGWLANLSPAGGPVLGPYARRSLALEAESAWLTAHVLPPPRP